MVNLWFFIPLLALLQCVYVYIGRRSAKKVESQSDYFLAGRRVRSLPLMMTFIGAQVGGGLVLGAADTAFTYGFSVLLYPLGTCLGLLVLGLGVGKKLASFQVATIAQILEVVYRSSCLKKVASFLSIISLSMILSAQFIASHKFLHALGMTSPLLFVAFWAAIVLYTVRGGLRAVISTDIAQATVFSFIFALCFMLISYQGHLPSFETVSFEIPSSKWVAWILMPFLYMIIEQDMGQRCFSAESPQAVSKAAIGACICTLLICLVPITLGVIGKQLGLTIPQGNSALMTTVSYLTNPYVTALVGCATLAAIVSTSASLLNAISSNLSQDFKLFSKTTKEARLLTLGIAASALVIAFYFNDIVGVLIQSYELFISALFVPIFMALFYKNATVQAAWTALVIGFGCFIFFKIFPTHFPYEIITLVLAFAGFLIKQFLQKNKKRLTEDVHAQHHNIS